MRTSHLAALSLLLISSVSFAQQPAQKEAKKERGVRMAPVTDSPSGWSRYQEERRNDPDKRLPDTPPPPRPPASSADRLPPTPPPPRPK